MKQYIEIDDELPELTGTSSPMPTLTSTSTSTSTTLSDRRKTRRQTRLDSYARLPVTMPTSSEEDEPVAQVPRSGRRAEKSRPGAPRRISRSWRGIDLHPSSKRLDAELWLRRRRLLCLWDTSDLSTVWRGVECLSTIRDVSRHRHPAGRPAAFPDGYGLRMRTDGQDRLRRPSHPPDLQGGPNPHEHGSCHVSHHLLMGTADVNRCGSLRSLMRDHNFL
jgi:hypothetical protein